MATTDTETGPWRIEPIGIHAYKIVRNPMPGESADTADGEVCLKEPWGAILTVTWFTDAQAICAESNRAAVEVA